MLAYVFWHWHVPQVTAANYQSLLRDFHQTLDTHRPAGFLGSQVVYGVRAPWPTRAAETYEDWYFVENSAALDPLDSAAVSGPRLEPHQQVARLAEGGTGGLFRLRAGENTIPVIRSASWFNKPAGMPYDALYELIQPFVVPGKGTLWQRQMTLGPATEFCLHAEAAVELPAELGALKIPLQQVWKA